MTPAAAVDALSTTALSSLPAAVPASTPSARIEQDNKSKKKVNKRKRRRRTRAKRSRRRARRGFVQLTSNGPGFVIRDPHRSWGTSLTLRRLKEVSSAYIKRFPQALPVSICDLSRRWGGKFYPHASHRTGRDVDLGLILKRPRRGWVKASAKTLHAERMWFLISSLVATGDVEYIFIDRRLQRAMYRFARSQGHSKQELGRVLQYPRRHGGIVRHWKGHRDHIHVRFVRPSRQLRRIPVS
ncbi:MAG: penicillin-insensitive murein endopeptidase [Deltaproteobacteria bacterium]|nr:penicillin-insensitive murein endopeptidase [Deltaproteobacteria bacterium]